LQTRRTSIDSPFGCITSSGAPAGPNDFVLGYTQVFAYDQFRNQNPIVGLMGVSFEVDGKTVEPDCIGDACVALAASDLALQGPPSEHPSGDAAAPEGGIGLEGGLALEEGGTSGGATTDATPPRSDAAVPPHVPAPPSCVGDDARCFPACTTDSDDDCPKHQINLVLDKANNSEHDDAAEAIEGRMVLEQMWINYYADNAKIEHDVKLLNDATTGWSPEHAADLRAPRAAGPFHVWGIAHDNRGGTQWVRVTLATKSPW
jgi:hypothetical protein